MAVFSVAAFGSATVRSFSAFSATLVSVFTSVSVAAFFTSVEISLVVDCSWASVVLSLDATDSALIAEVAVLSVAEFWSTFSVWAADAVSAWTVYTNKG